MKGSKSKGKSITSAHQIIQSQTVKKKRINIIPPINTVAKQFTVHFINGKVIFDITNIEPTLARTLLFSFNDSQFNISQSSLLNQLKVRKQYQFEMTYRHTLDTKSAIFLYSKLMRKRLGQVNQLDQIKEMIDIIEIYPISSEQLQNNFQLQRLELNDKIQKLRRNIKGYYNNQRQKIRNQYFNSEAQFKAEILEQKIKKLSRNLIDMMIVAIKQQNSNKIQVIFEQPYPQKTCTPQFLINIIGQSNYIKKKINFIKFYRIARINHRTNTNFIICHFCKQIIIDSYIRCKNISEKRFTPTYYNSPNIYQRNFLVGDYCYHQITDLTDKQLQNELDYFKYYSNSQKYPCNRFACKKCADSWIVIENQKDIFNYNCAFCNKSCMCPSCSIAQQLVKALALYKDIIISNFQPISKYEQLVSYANFDHPQAVEVFTVTRNTFKSLQKKQYYQYYQKLFQSFVKINKIMDKFQSEAIRSFSLFIPTKIMINQYMIQVRKFMKSLKQSSTTQKKSNSLGGKSLQKIKNEQKQFQKQFERKKQLQKNEENLIIKYLNTNSKNKIKQLSLRQKILNNIQLSKITRKFQVPFEVNDLFQYQIVLQDTQITNIKNNIIKQLIPFNQNNFNNISYFKSQIPFEEVDYDLAINVKNQSKIITQRDIQIKKNKEMKLMYQLDNPFYGFKGKNYQRIYEDANQLMNALSDNDSDSSESEYYQGTTPFADPGSISISNQFLQRHNIQISKSQSQAQLSNQFQQQVDVIEIQDADSQFLLMNDKEISQIQNKQYSQNRIQNNLDLNNELIEIVDQPQMSPPLRTYNIYAPNLLPPINQVSQRSSSLQYKSKKQPQQLAQRQIIQQCNSQQIEQIEHEQWQKLFK